MRGGLGGGGDGSGGWRGVLRWMEMWLVSTSYGGIGRQAHRSLSWLLHVALRRRRRYTSLMSDL